VVDTRLRPHLPRSGRTAGLLRDRLWLDVEGDAVVAGDGRGRRHRFTVGTGPGQAAELAIVVRDTAERFLQWLAVVDGEGRPLAVSEASQWESSEVRRFAGRAGLGFSNLRFHDFPSFDAWLGGARPVRLDAAPGYLWPVAGVGVGLVVGILLAVVAPGPDLVWVLAGPVLGLVAAWAADDFAGRRR
jgi:hypothetical protein